MIHPIIVYDNPLLRIRSSDIERYSTLDLPQLIDDLFETMHKAKGIGLSAIQIGIPLRIFVIEAHLEEENFHFRDIFINPIITREWGEKAKYSEGCLSVPQITAQVERFSNIELSWYDKNWQLCTQEFDGMTARIIQHEYDHLDGIIFIDKIDKMWANILEYPLELIKNNEVKTSYLIK